MSGFDPVALPRRMTRRLFGLFRRGTDATFSAGNSVTLLPDGPAFFADLFATLAAAQHAIRLEFYIVHADQTGEALARLLAAAVQRGVAVTFLYDYFGCFDTPTAYFSRLQAAGVRCAPFNPPPFRFGLRWFDRRDHRKIVVIDNQIAYAGGLNIGDEYAGIGMTAWHDLGVRLRGPAVAELHRLFAETWEETTKDRLPMIPAPATAGDAIVAIVAGSPRHVRPRIRNAFHLAIAGAGHRICIETPYFIPGLPTMRTLLRAARRGVAVQLILPEQSDVPLVRLLSRSFYGPLLKGGIRISERRQTILHAKVMMIDDAWGVIGSANLDQRSFHRNDEVNIIVASPSFGQQLDTLLAAEIAASRPISHEENARRGLGIRFLEACFSPLAWFL